MPADSPIKKTVVVNFGGETFTFRMPSIRDEIQVGVRTRKILTAAAGGEAVESEDMLDNSTRFLARASAVFETQLESTSADWVYSSDPVSKLPIVNSALFPEDKAEVVFAIVVDYNGQVSTFRSGGAANKPPADDKAVAG